MPKVNTLVGGVNNDVDAAAEKAGSDAPAENPETILLLVSAFFNSRAFGIEPTAPAAVVELQMKGTFSTLFIATFLRI